jgi:hypothetical protein
MKKHGLQNMIKTIMFCHDSFKLERNPVEMKLFFYRENMTPSHPCLWIKLISVDEFNPIDQMNPVYDLCPNAMICICYSC